MIKKTVIEEVKKRLIETYNPIAIYVFGSYAWGTPTEDSDLDLLIVVDESEEKSYKRPIAGHRALRGLNISKDLIIKTKKEFEQDSGNKTTLIYKIKNDGELIYARIFEKLYDDAENLNPFATKFRYPTEFDIPDSKDTKNSIERTKKVVDFVLEKITKQTGQKELF